MTQRHVFLTMLPTWYEAPSPDLGLSRQSMIVAPRLKRLLHPTVPLGLYGGPEAW